MKESVGVSTLITRALRRIADDPDTWWQKGGSVLHEINCDLSEFFLFPLGAMGFRQPGCWIVVALLMTLVTVYQMICRLLHLC